MQVMNSFIVYFLTFSNLVVLISSKKLPPCAERELYKTEYHRKDDDYNDEKLKTKLKCKCNADRKNTEMTQIEHPTENNTWIRDFRCLIAPKKQLPPCNETQICKRKFFYNYGRNRIGKQYVDTTEDYCDCQYGLECEKIGFLPKSIIYPFDNILSFRCTPYIYEYNELRPCKKNQTYLAEIYRYKSLRGSHSIKLNTYIKCICETNLWTITENYPPIVDPADEEQSVRTYICPWLSRPSVEASCKDFAICRKGYETDVGTEEPDKWMTYYFRIYCRCDQGRECLNVGKIGHETIHRCFKNNTKNMRKNCKKGDICRVEIHQKNPVPKNRTAKVIEVKLNTIEMCICFGIIKNTGNDSGPYDGNEYVTKYRCEVNSTLQEMKLPYCFKNEDCRINHIDGMGIERGNLTFRKTSVYTCICSFPRTCSEVEKPTSSSGVDRCILSNETENELESCSYYELYKVVIYTNLTDSKGEPKITRKNTIFMCKCEHTLYDVYEGSMTISRDPRDRKRRIWSYFCPRPKNITKELQSCEDYEICRNDVYETYGEDVGPNSRYLLNSFTYCKCDKDRYCFMSKKEEPGKDLTIINTFRCVKEACMEHELCRIEEYSGNKELEQNITLCHCTGECSYRPVHSIAYSWEYKNVTQYYTCKFRTSEKPTTTDLRTLLKA